MSKTQFNLDYLDDGIRQGLRDHIQGSANSLIDLYKGKYGSKSAKDALWAYLEVQDNQRSTDYEAGFLHGCTSMLEVLFGKEGKRFVGNIMHETK